ncbi:MAG: DNA-3-methyladenine glycosylase 2 family protein [Chloroflexi bacterium]|nr:DNA-3-methyladenine glycosylase 2 family protein [Chloroflexota bacterium]
MARRTATDLSGPLAALKAADPVMAAFIERAGEVPARGKQGNYFASLARSILYQQLAGRAAAAIHGRFIEAIGGVATPEAVLQASPETLRGAGLSAAKTAAILDLASRVSDGSVPLDALDEFDDEEIIRRLSLVRGIGRWTAEMFLMFELARPDVWPVDDYGVRSGWTMIYGLPELIKPGPLRQEGERFRPHRSLAAQYCWQAVHLQRGGLILPADDPGS